MSFASVNPPDAREGLLLLEPRDSPSKTTYRSYKKKYRKMKHKFEEKMRESNSLFREEQKAIELARRLQEQNDQLLDVLLDINESNLVPPHLRYNLRSPTPDASAVPALEPDLSPRNPSDVKSALSAPQEAKDELATGQITPTSYTNLEAALLDTNNEPQALIRLDTTPHTTLQSVIPGYLPEDLDVDTPTGYLSPGHEEEYLSTLDISIGTSQSVPSRNLPPHAARSSDKHEKDKEAQLRNPVSVYNWLRKNQPQVFLQDNEVVSEKPAAKPQPVPKLPKRSSIAPKQEQEIIDEDGFVIGGLAEPSKPKRKREDEPYRPKGGSSRPTKKKKVSGGQNGKKGIDDQGY